MPPRDLPRPNTIPFPALYQTVSPFGTEQRAKRSRLKSTIPDAHDDDEHPEDTPKRLRLRTFLHEVRDDEDIPPPASDGSYGFICADSDDEENSSLQGGSIAANSQTQSQVQSQSESQSDSVSEMLLRCYEEPLGTSQEVDNHTAGAYAERADEEEEEVDGVSSNSNGSNDDAAERPDPEAVFRKQVAEWEFHEEHVRWETQLARRQMEEALQQPSPLEAQLHAGMADQPARLPTERELSTLRGFDLALQYGPSMGVSRLRRWQRAEKFGMAPPRAVREILETLDGNSLEQAPALPRQFPWLA